MLSYAGNSEQVMQVKLRKCFIFVPVGCCVSIHSTTDCGIPNRICYNIL